jgi:uncharacterized protein (DUF58 family)
MVGGGNAMFRLYRRMFRPNGVVLGDSREYVPGDDTRFINWNITAKTGVPFVDGVRADSGNGIIFAIDGSESMKFGTKRQSKMALAVAIASTLSQLAGANGDGVGLLYFSNKIEKYMPIYRHGKDIHHIIGAIANGGRRLGTDLLCAVKFLNCVLRKRTTVILICDVFALAKNRNAVVAAMHGLAKKNDVMAITITDDGDMPSVNVGKITVEDGESGEVLEIDSGDSRIMAMIAEKYGAYCRLIFRDLRSIGIKTICANTSNSAEEFLFTFFERFL